MNRFQVVLTACVFTAAAAWGQAANSANSQPASQGATSQNAATQTGAQPQSGAQAQMGQNANGTAGAQPATTAAASGNNTISGCMVKGFANYQLSDSTSQSSYQIRGNGASLDQYANHVVQIQGVLDPKDSQNGKTIFYASKVQDMGQTCGAGAQQVAGNASQNSQMGTATTSPNSTAGVATGSTVAQAGTAQQNQPGASSETNSTQTAQAGSASSGQSGSEATTNTTAATGTQQGTTATTPNSSEASAMSQQGGTAGTTTTSQQQGGVEEHGTPQAGVPQNSTVGSNSSAASGVSSNASRSTSNGQTYQGCLKGSPNNLKLKVSGKTYTLQGSTASLNALVGHQVEINGSDFGGTAIQVNSGHDVGSTCSAK